MVATLNATGHGSTQHEHQREQLIAHWDLVGGKLICHWDVVKPTTDHESDLTSDNVIHFPGSHHAA